MTRSPDILNLKKSQMTQQLPLSIQPFPYPSERQANPSLALSGKADDSKIFTGNGKVRGFGSFQDIDKNSALGLGGAGVVLKVRSGES